MKDSLEVLKDIGAQQIHKDTHITKEHVQAIIHGSYEGLNEIQFIGFISILEREYKVDLSELKVQAKKYFAEISEKSDEEHNLFVTTQKDPNYASIYIALGIIIFLSVTYYSFGYLSSMATEEMDANSSQIESIQQGAETFKIDINTSKNKTVLFEDKNTTQLETKIQIDSNTSQAKIEEPKEEEILVEKVEVVRSLKILPKNKIWTGYIDINTNQKYQKVFRKEFAMDTKRDWLLLFGSGTVNLEVNGEKKTFTSKQNMRFKYRDGEFKKITLEEFKKLNKGRKW